MLQQVYNSTLLNSHIQQLICSTPLPKYKLIHDNEWMDAGVVYQCADRILKCTQSGMFPGILGLQSVLDYLYVNDKLTVTETGTVHILKEDGTLSESPLVVTDDKVKFKAASAKWDLLGTVDSKSVKHFMESVTLCDSAYSSKVHKYLGEYLRWLRNSTSLNLMPLYNCYSNTKLSGWKITSDGIAQDSNSSLYVVPIKFNRTYTISARSPLPIKMSAAFLSTSLLKVASGQSYMHEHISDNVTVVNSVDPSMPFTYTLSSAQCSSELCPYTSLVEFESALCLLIDAGNVDLTSLVVIEGDYAHSSCTSCGDISAVNAGALSSDKFSESLASRLSLLSADRVDYMPFASKLLSYLFRYTIDCRDDILENVSWAENAVGYKSSHLGMWDLKLQYLLHRRYEEVAQERRISSTDILGYVDIDIEAAIRKGILKRD